MNIETLPDEIFLHHIFPLLSWEELYLSFLNLNQRFNRIVRSVKHLRFVVDTTNEYHLALNIFTRCIGKMIVYLGHFDIQPFVNLRSIDLHYPTARQRNAIRPENFPFLEHLRLAYPLEDSILLNLIFSNAFEHLKSCYLDRTVTDHSWHGSPQVRSISISVYDSYGIVCILRACPNLVRLNIIVYNVPQTNLSLPRQSISCINLSLRYLFIRSNFPILIGVLTCAPNLKKLIFEDININMGYRSMGFDLKLLGDTLFKLNQLVYLHCTIHNSAWNDNISWRSLHPLFQCVRGEKISVVISGSMSKNK